MTSAERLFASPLAKPVQVCQLGDLKPGHRVYSPDCETEYVVTDCAAREGFTVLVQLDSGTAREFSNSTGLYQYRSPKLRMGPSFIG